MRILHTMLRIADMQRSVDFYTRVMGMKLLRRVDRPQDGYALSFVGYGEEATDAVLELTQNYSKSQYELGTAYGHIAIEVKNAAAACERIASLGGKIVRKAGPVMGGTTNIAFVEDPDGYRIELIENPAAAED